MLRSIFGRGRNRPEPAQSVAANSIRNARVGDVVTVQGFALEYDQRYFVVDNIHRYGGNGVIWYELVVSDADYRLWLEWSQDGDDLFVTITDNRRPAALEALGLTESDLMEMDERRSIGASVTVEGRPFFYRNSFEAFYFPDNRPTDGEGFYLWEFLSDDETQTLSVTKFEGIPFEAHLTQIIPADSVTLYPGERPEQRSR